MARGRKPIQRTKEEAVAIRKAQIRRNVKAYRQRKEAAAKSRVEDQEGSKRWTFVRDGIDITRGGTDAEPKQCQSAHQHSETGHGDPNIAIEAPVASVKVQRLQRPQHAGSPCPRFERLTNARAQPCLPPVIDSARLSRQQFVSNSRDIFLPGNRLGSGQSIEVGPHWAQTLPILINKCDVLDSAVQALCLLQIGCVKQEPWLLEAAGSYYGRTLQRLNTALSEPGTTFRKGIFATSLVLATYELFNGTPIGWGVGWKYHLEGASAYLNRLPFLDQALSDQPAFHFLETVVIFGALRARKVSPFTHSKWWSLSLSRFGGNTYGPLLRIITLIPPLLEESDNLALSVLKSDCRATSMALLEKVLSLEDRLNEWLDQVTTNVPNYRYDVSMSTAGGSTRFLFPTLYICRLHLLFWSSIIALHDVIRNITNIIQEFTAPTAMSPWALTNATLLKQSQTQSDEFAMNIHKSIDFCLRPSHGLVGKSVLLQPLWFAQIHFDGRNSKEAGYCLQVLKGLGQDHIMFKSPARPSPGTM